MNNNRINWIDWAKFLAITMVVFGHIPEPTGSFLPFYICTFHIPFFFFISGYLTKPRTDIKDELKKCVHSLVIPYFIYNILFYPYWAIRLYIDHGVDFSIFDYIVKPLIGLFFLQIDTPISSNVNGAMWFIAVLLIMRITLHICLKSSKSLYYIVVIALLFVGVYVISIILKMSLPCTIEGLFKCMPLYLLGYITRQFLWLHDISLQKDSIRTTALLPISLAATYIYKESSDSIIQLLSFYIILLSAIYGFLSLCKVLNSIRSTIIVNISLGTLMIMGLHWMFIGSTNYILEHIFSMSAGITYPWYMAIVFALCIDLAIFPLIILAKRRMPILLGK